jgi:prolipoprotein diacylglyceryltransferase
MLKGSGVGVMNVGGPFVLNIDPLLLDIGGIKIWYYGLAYALGFFGILVWLMRRRLTIGLPVNEVWSLSIIYAVSSLIGGRVFEILVYEWDIYKVDPLEMLRFWHGGMASHGVILGVLHTNEMYFLSLMNLLSPRHCFSLWACSAIILTVKFMGIRQASGGQ